MSPMKYKGYVARIEYSDDDGLFIGHIAGIQDVIGFHGESVSELRQSFHEAVDDYLDTCAKLGREPQKPYSGKLSLRLDPALHARVALKAELSNKSINQWVAERLSEAV
ncbi:type II toxin-antitoxin system HicB family antitoxin [Pseudomonas citronellolis]|uniref:type II toxin-antitoxin system HicB family antitoxin n=1 Tax=Pseudomonas citronellolis TaxID=53408 RepID=UPI000E2F1F1D|nr:type II toxin-antitoxin system HicB family antitoxin [Pseudomonas citronellolis]MCP1607216.1 putative HicB family RNase H-like nuclease [Pseudomonas citronellolis]MCP1658062.1 putative HicB family RNase H-like nuclease [Pseudomonas citronellolis]MCP1724983.1 putative HicB family RNase H-like nuclease [Pseudomonas citronellolis]GBL59516.1 DNA repair protein HhH-GPD [Pseudomonas citronellolis]